VVSDEEVPMAGSKTLFAEMLAAGKLVQFYMYPRDGHIISGNFAMQRTAAFFEKYVKDP
jgi:dipeptidyl aminopeptidase/acylaminoacyl peptidase